jgi:hypothetical protein
MGLAPRRYWPNGMGNPTFWKVRNLRGDEAAEYVDPPYAGDMNFRFRKTKKPAAFTGYVTKH